MAIEKEEIIAKIEVVGTWNVQVAIDMIIKEDGVEIGRSRTRKVFQPYTSSKDSDDKWTHTDRDISSEATEVQAVANAVWTDTVKTSYKNWVEEQTNV